MRMTLQGQVTTTRCGHAGVAPQANVGANRSNRGAQSDPGNASTVALGATEASTGSGLREASRPR